MGRKRKGSDEKKKTLSHKKERKEESKEEETTDLWQSESVLINAFNEIGYDGTVFTKHLRESVEIRRRKNKEPLQILYLHYVTWAVALRKKEIGPLKDGEQPKYSFPPAVLAFLRSLVPENIKGELWPEAYKVSLKEFADGLDIPKKLFV